MANIGTNLYDGSFVGGTDDIKLSENWWNNWLRTTRIITISNNDCATVIAASPLQLAR